MRTPHSQLYTQLRVSDKTPLTSAWSGIVRVNLGSEEISGDDWRFAWSLTTSTVLTSVCQWIIYAGLAQDRDSIIHGSAMQRCANSTWMVFLWEGGGVDSRQTRHGDPVLASCWAVVYDVGPTLSQNWVPVSCLPDRFPWHHALRNVFSRKAYSDLC